MDWLREDYFVFHQELPDRLETDHLLIMGLRSDDRAYHAWISVPERLEHRPEAYKALRVRFDAFLNEPATTQSFTIMQYAELVQKWIKRVKGFMLDTFPTGE